LKTKVIKKDEAVIFDGQSALDFAVNAGCKDIAVYKEMICEDFFKLSTGIAGEITQKFVNYGFRLAIIGDFSQYKSKPLHDFICECNRGGHLYFVKNEDEATEKLS
jgi:hypothetical protein